MGAKLKYQKGEKVGSCEFIKELPAISNKGSRGLFRCDCGNEFESRISAIKNGEINSCGCLRLKKQLEANLIQYQQGDKINEFVFIKRLESSSSTKKAVFVCPYCKNEFITRISSIKNGHTKSCGCYKIDRITKEATIHGMTGSQEYKSWQHMKARCNNPNHQSYKDYGGRGISVCKRWENSFENFLADMGAAPSSKHSLDRFPDKNGNYEPSNCRWATSKQQALNTRRNVIVSYLGEKKTISEWAEILGMEYKTLAGRLKISKWDVIKAMQTPVKPRKRVKK